MDSRDQIIIDFLNKKGEISSKELFDQLNPGISYPTLKRTLQRLIKEGYLSTKGQGKGTRYLVSPLVELIQEIDIEEYFTKEIDEREIRTQFNFEIVSPIMAMNSIFTEEETALLTNLQNAYRRNVEKLSPPQYLKELERLAIDLSWKSSQIEGNTYSLLETERLIKEKETASGKTKEEAQMLLNHKEAIDFIIDHTDYLNPLSVLKIEDVHTLLTKDLGIDKNIRKQRVGISGTNYRPLDNDFQIREALEIMCSVVNSKENVFEKALIALVLISYIQPFNDGNKRTARIASNAILMHNKYCPISFRSVDSIEYKKAMLLFYEQNNISGIKRIFIEQFEFAVNTYF